MRTQEANRVHERERRDGTTSRLVPMHVSGRLSFSAKFARVRCLLGRGDATSDPQSHKRISGVERASGGEKKSE